MNAVGIDVSKGKSMVAALRPMGEVALLPQEFLHTEVGLEQMAYTIIALGEDTRVIMEATGRYHEPVAAALHEYGIYVCVLNPLFIKQSGGGSIRKVKGNGNASALTKNSEHLDHIKTPRFHRDLYYRGSPRSPQCSPAETGGSPHSFRRRRSPSHSERYAPL